jgi:pimeloyl-ACP methyl ester carboxylesterase
MPQLCSFPAELLGATFERPVTVIAGERSDYVPRHNGSAFVPMFPRVQVEVLPGAGHWVHADQPASFVALVKQALKRHTPLQRSAATSAS